MVHKFITCQLLLVRNPSLFDCCSSPHPAKQSESPDGHSEHESLLAGESVWRAETQGDRLA